MIRLQIRRVSLLWVFPHSNIYHENLSQDIILIQDDQAPPKAASIMPSITQYLYIIVLFGEAMTAPAAPSKLFNGGEDSELTTNQEE